MAATPAKKAKRLQPGPGSTHSGLALTEVDWNRILLTMLRGASAAEAARLTGFNERTVRRLIGQGYPKQPWGQTPMRILIAQEQTKARAMRASLGLDPTLPPKEERPDYVAKLNAIEAGEATAVASAVGSATPKERVAAQEDALEARNAEATMVKVARANVLILATTTLDLVRPTQEIAKAIMERVLRDVRSLKVTVKDGITSTTGGLDPIQGLAILHRTASVVKAIVETGHKAMEMERLLLGDPAGGGKLAQDAASMTDEEMYIELTNASKVVMSLERRGLRLVQGGRGVSGGPVGGSSQAFAGSSPSHGSAASSTPTGSEGGPTTP